MKRAWAAAAAALLVLAACAVPPIERSLLHRESAPVRVEGARGPLSHARAAGIVAELRRKSPDTGILEGHLAVEQALAGTPLSVGNQVTLLEDGQATFAAMLEAIAAARHHVHFETYIFDADETGRNFAEALLERHRAGVQVRLVYDSVGSMKTPQEFFQRMADGGIEVVEYNPITPGTVLSRGTLLNRRNHRKLIVVDGLVAFLGGINISDVHTSGSTPRGRGGAEPFENRPWRDTHVRIVGPVVADFQKSFLRMWSRITRQAAPSEAALFPRVEPRGPHAVRAVEGWLADGLNPLYVTLISAIESAERRVRIAMAYFVPHEELLAVLKGAAARGVEVELLLPSRTDHWLVFHAGRSYYGELLEAGVKIHERRSRLLHAKTATVDGVWSTVGSTNLDWRSLLYNDELNAVVLGTEFAAALEASFERDLAQSHAITPLEWSRRPLKDCVREAAARAWARLL